MSKRSYVYIKFETFTANCRETQGLRIALNVCYANLVLARVLYLGFSLYMVRIAVNVRLYRAKALRHIHIPCVQVTNGYLHHLYGARQG